MFLSIYDASVGDMAVMAMVARNRLAREHKLSLPEAEAIIVDVIRELAHDGCSFEQVVGQAVSHLDRSQVMDGVAETLTSVRCVAVFPSGTHVVIVHNPVR